MKQSVIDFVNEAMKNARLDIDIEYCKKYNIKFNDTVNQAEIDFLDPNKSNDDLFNSKSNQAAFDFVMKLKK